MSGCCTVAVAAKWTDWCPMVSETGKSSVLKIRLGWPEQKRDIGVRRPQRRAGRASSAFSGDVSMHARRGPDIFLRKFSSLASEPVERSQVVDKGG
jgi:hypothetical protein